MTSGNEIRRYITSPERQSAYETMRTLANKQHERDMNELQRRSTMRDNDDLIRAFNLDRRAKSHALPHGGYTERLYDYHSQLKRNP